jgi:hypothetical protein
LGRSRDDPNIRATLRIRRPQNISGRLTSERHPPPDDPAQLNRVKFPTPTVRPVEVTRLVTECDLLESGVSDAEATLGRAYAVPWLPYDCSMRPTVFDARSWSKVIMK